MKVKNKSHKKESGLALVGVILGFAIASLTILGSALNYPTIQEAYNELLEKRKIKNIVESQTQYLTNEKIESAKINSYAVATVLLSDGSFSSYKIKEAEVEDSGNKYVGEVKAQFLSGDVAISAFKDGIISPFYLNDGTKVIGAVMDRMIVGIDFNGVSGYPIKILQGKIEDGHLKGEFLGQTYTSGYMIAGIASSDGSIREAQVITGAEELSETEELVASNALSLFKEIALANTPLKVLGASTQDIGKYKVLSQGFSKPVFDKSKGVWSFPAGTTTSNISSQTSLSQNFAAIIQNVVTQETQTGSTPANILYPLYQPLTQTLLEGIRDITSSNSRLAVDVEGGVAKLSLDLSGLATPSSSSTTLTNGSVTESKIADSAVTTSKISDGTITNADISTTANISDSKLDTISTANKVAGSALQLSATGGLVNNSGLSLLASCSDGQILKWNGSTTTWECNNDGGGSGGGSLDIQENDSTITSSASTLDFLGADFSLTNSPTGESNVSIDYTNSKIVRSNQNESITGVFSFTNGLTINSETVTDLSGTGITVTGGALTATLGTSVDISDETNLSASDGITLTADGLTNSDKGSSQNIFKTILISGQSDVVSDSNTDSLTLIAGSNITLTTNATDDTVTIAATDTNTTYLAGNDLDLTGTTFDIESTLDSVSIVNLVGVGTINGLDVIDNTSESTIESAIDTLGNLTSASSLVTVGTLTTGATGIGFTLNFTDSTLSGNITGANISGVDVSDDTNLTATGGVALTGDQLSATLGTSIANSELDNDTIDLDKVNSTLTLDEQTTVAAGSALNLRIGNNVTFTTTGTGSILGTDLLCTDCIGSTEISGLTWSELSATPTTLSGYGITDGVGTSTSFSGDISGVYNSTTLGSNTVDDSELVDSLSYTGALSLSNLIVSDTSVALTGLSFALDFNNASDRTITFSNSGAGSANLVVDGTLGASNLSGSSSGTNTGDQTITLTGDVTGGGTGSFAATIAVNSVALTTDTTGNYVSTITNGNGISGSSSTEGGTPTIALGVLTGDWDQTGAFDIQLNNSSSELKILESGSTPSLYGVFDVGDLSSSDSTFTFSGGSGTVLTSANTSSALSGWDQDSSNDLTTSTTFGGDVSGSYSSISLGSGTIDDAELADTLSYTGALTVSNLTVSDTNIPLTGGNTTVDLSAASTRTLTLTNSNVSNVLNLSVEGDISGASITTGGDIINEFAGTGLQVIGNTLSTSLGTTVANSELDNDTVDFDKISDTLTLDAGTSITAGSSLSLTVGNNVTLTTSGGGVINASDLVCTNCIGSTEILGLAWTELSGTPADLSGYGITDALSNSVTSTQDAHFGDIYLKDDTTPSHYLQITNAENLTGAHVLSLSLGNGDRSLTISGDSTISGTNTGDQTISLTGDITGSGTGSFATTIAADSVALTTDTTGNYVTSITNGSGITGANGGSEGAALTLALGALTSDWGQSGAFDILLSNASSELKIKESSGDTYYGILEVGDLASADATYTFSGTSGTVLTSANTSSALSGWDQDSSNDLTTSTSFSGDVSGAYNSNSLGSNTVDDSELVDTLSYTGALTLSNLTISDTSVPLTGTSLILDFNNASDRTLTIANSGAGTSHLSVDGTIAGSNLSGTNTGDQTITLTGDVTGGGTGSFAATIAVNSVALTTDTTGNYVANVTAGNNAISIGSSAGEGWAPTVSLTIAPSADALSSTTSSGSGFEILSSGVSLLQGCSTGQILKWNETTDVWECSSDAIGGGSMTIQEGASGVVAGASAVNFAASDFVVTDQGSNVAGVALDYSNLSGTAVGLTSGDLSCTNCIGATEISDLTIGTDTTGNYVASANTSVLTGLTGGSSGSEGAALTLAFDYSQALSGSVGLGADAAVFGVSGLVFEGSSADTVETFISVTNPTSTDKTITIPDATGTVILSGHTFTSDVTATLGSGGTTALTIAGDSVALTTDTTGNYVSTITSGLGISGSSSTEGGTPTIALDVSAALSGDHTLNANEEKFGVSGLIFEGSTANTIETYFAITDPTSTDKTITFPDSTGTVLLSGHTFTSDVTATLGSGGTTALTIAADSVALTTDTSGNYVASTNTSVLTGLTGGSSGSEGAALTLALDYSQALSGDVGLGANAAVFGVSGLVFEGSSANTAETFIAVTNPTSDRTITIPDAAGTIILSGHSFTGDVTATLDTDGGTALTIANDSVTLTTDTSGNYVAGATSSGGLSLTGTEGATLGILLPTATDALSSTTSSGSGMELLSAGVSLLQGCSDGQILKWTESSDTWSCQNDNSSAGGGVSNIDENNASVLGSAISIDFLGSDFNVTADSTEGDIAIDYTNSGITRKSSAETITGGWTFNTVATTFTTAINANGGIALSTSNIDGTNFDVVGSSGNVDIGGTITAGSGNEVITLATGKIDADALTLTAAADGGTGTSSGSGLVARSDGIGLLQGCSDGQVLKWVESTDTWDCAADSTGGGSSWTQVTKSANQTITNSTTLTNDTHLLFAASANTAYAVEMVLMQSSTNTTHDFKYAFTIPASSTMSIGAENKTNTTATAGCNLVTSGTACAVNNAVAATRLNVTAHGYIITSGTAGNVQLQWAGNTASASNSTTVYKHSLLRYTSLGGADLAEMYYSDDESIVPGDVVAIDPKFEGGVRKTNTPYDKGAIGIVSTKPGLLLGDGAGDLDQSKIEGKKAVDVALVGRVPLKVTTENGSIQAGDLLTPSSIPGVAMKATKAGTIIGQSLTPFEKNSENPNDIGQVVAFVKTSYSVGSGIAGLIHNIETGQNETETTDTGKKVLSAFLSQSDYPTSELSMSEVVADRVAAGVEVITPRLVTNEVETNGLTVDGTLRATTIKADRIEGLEIYTDKIASLSELYEKLQAEVSGIATESGSLENDESLLNGRVLNLEVMQNFYAQKGLIVEENSEFRGNSIFKSVVEFLGDVIFRGDINLLGRIYFNKDTAGFAIVPAGAIEVTVNFEKEYVVVPAITASPDTPIIYSITDVTAKGFKIKLVDPIETDVKFSWHAVAVKDVSVVKGIFQPITPVPSATRIATEVPQATVEPTITNSPLPTEVPNSTPTTTIGTLTVISNELGFVRLREEPTTDSSELAQIPVGKTLDYQEKITGWYKVGYQGIVGWVSGTYIVLD